MLKKNLLTIFLSGIMCTASILILMKLYSQNVFCLDQQGCDPQEQCVLLICQSQNKGQEYQDHQSSDLHSKAFKAPMDTFCQKSCEYNRLSKKALLHQYGLSSVPIEFQKNSELVKKFYQSAYHDCMGSVEIEQYDEKNNHCLKTAHSVCVMQCESEKVEKVEPLETSEDFLQLPLPKKNFDQASNGKTSCMLAAYQNKHLSSSQIKFYGIDENQSVSDQIKKKYALDFEVCKKEENVRPTETKLSEDEMILYCTKKVINMCLINDLSSDVSSDSSLPEKLDGNDVLGVIRKNISNINHCKSFATKPVKINVRVIILNSGDVQSTEILDPAEQKGSDLGKCLEEKIKSFKFPQFSNPNMSVKLPFSF